MKRHVLRLFIWVALLASVLPAQAISIYSIRAAIEDELYDLAEEQIWEKLSTDCTLEERTDLTILLARAMIGEGRFQDAIILCNESNHLLQPDAFLYWKANAQVEGGQISAALQTLEIFPENSPYLPAALRLRGRAAVSDGELKTAEEVFQRFDKLFPNSEDAAQNLLDLAHVSLERGRGRNAQNAFAQLLKRFPDTIEADSGRLLLARELIADGRVKAQEKAADLLRKLGSTETAHPRMRIAAWVELSGIEKAAGRVDASVEALQKAEAFTKETDLRIRQKAAQANLLFDENKPDEAFALFDEAIASAPDQEIAAEVLVQKAEALLELKKLPEAETAFQACLDVTEQTEIQQRALSGKAWSLWGQNRFEESATVFEQTVAKSTGSNEQIEAYIKAGDAWLKAKKYEQAYEDYRRASEIDLRHPLAAQAAYQSGIALLKNGASDKAFRYFQTVEINFPESEFARQAALRRAEILQSQNNPEGTLEEYVRIVEQYTNAPVRSAAMHREGLVLFELNRYDEALAVFNAVLKDYPDSTQAPQAFYMRGFCRYLQGNAAEALQIFREFIETYPGSNWAPEVLFLLAEHAYNTGDYPQAHRAFLDITDRFPRHELADAALFWAGSALLKQDSFLEAFTLFSRLVGDYPDSALLMDTRFAQGEALTELGEFSRAILAYDEIIKTAPDTLTADRARGRLGDCLFTLGATEPERYKEALETYQALYKKTDIPFELKLQALCKIARCEEKTGQTDAALEHYTEAVYSIGEHKEALSPTAVLWFTRAALEAADLLERQQKWREAVHLYERIIQAEVPAADEADKLIRKIRQEHPKEF